MRKDQEKKKDRKQIRLVRKRQEVLFQVVARPSDARQEMDDNIDE